MFELTVSFGILFLFTGALFYLILCIDPNNPGILGKIHRFVYKFLPSVCSKVCGGENSKFFKGLNGFFNYLCYTNHPLVQFFYILVAPGGFCLYWYSGFSVHFDDNPNVSHYHKYFAAVFSYFSFYTYYLACKVGPGEITKDNQKYYMKKYEHYFDGILYHKKNICKTCKFEKPARSKHCSTCKMCVSKFDHHCIWIRQCVGEKNYKYFLTFLIVHAALCLYGLYIGIYCIMGIVAKERLLEAKFRAPDGSVVDATWGVVVRYLFFKETLFVFIVILCGIMGITLVLFYSYHLTLVKSGLTTNEKIKRSDCMTYIKKAVREALDLAKVETNEERKAELHIKLEKLTSDYEKLEKWQPKKSLFQSLKEIYKA